MWIDTHCHLDASEFDSDLAAVAEAAWTAGVAAIVVPAIEVANFASVRSCCQHFDRAPRCLAAYGIHPLFTPAARESDLETLRAWLESESAVAIGEIGLDGFVAGLDPAAQEFWLVEQLKLAREFDLPVLLHVRRAQDAVLKQLRRFRVRGGIAHAFNGSRQQADQFIDLGFVLGFGGAMTFPRATRIRQLAAELPITSIVLETDAPDIAPSFATGRRNSPEYLPRIARSLAELRGISEEELAAALAANFRRVLTRA